jgi:DNA-3-methyladenine glycosylase II
MLMSDETVLDAAMHLAENDPALKPVIEQIGPCPLRPQDLALHVLDGSVVLDKFDDFTNEEIITELTVVKGIGEWTVHMFLIFCMGRSDVLPVGDLGIKNGIRKLYGLQSQTTPDDITRIAAQNHWHPYESVASWYVWQSLKLPD